MEIPIITDEYVKVTDLQIMQRMLIELFHDFHDLCEKHRLVYNMFGGTMLGAVRHQGMIPWDNDVDVTMPRPDYDRFLQIVHEEYSDQYIAYHYPEMDYPYPYAKFGKRGTILIEPRREKYSYYSLYIDIFPVDGYPTEKESTYFGILKLMKRFRGASIAKCTLSKNKWKTVLFPLKVLYILLCRVFPIGFYIGIENALAQKYDYNSSDAVLLQGAGWNQKGKLEKSTYVNRKLYRFEDFFAWGIANYDEHLTRLYGDYMTPPPENKRIPNHDIELYVKRKELENMKEKGQ